MTIAGDPNGSNTKNNKNMSIKTLTIGCGRRKFGLGIDLIHDSDADIIADAHNLPFRDYTFKVVVLEEVLEHLHDPKKALDEIRRVSNWIYLTVPNIFYFGRFLRFITQQIANITHDHYWSFPIEELHNLLRITGWSIWSFDYLKGHYHKRQLPTLLFRHCLRVVAYAKNT